MLTILAKGPLTEEDIENMMFKTFEVAFNAGPIGGAKSIPQQQVQAQVVPFLCKSDLSSHNTLVPL